MITIRAVLLAVGAMFIALAVGVALGAGPLQGDSDNRWRAEVNQHDRQRAKLDRELSRLRADTGYRDEFVSTVDDGLVADTLTNHHIALVQLPGADRTYADELRSTLEAAGATVTGRVTVEQRWAQPGQQQLLEDTSTRLVTEDTVLPESGGAYERAGAVLARALVTTDAERVGQPDTDTTAILAGFAAAELIRAGDELARADLAVVVAPPAPADSEAAEETDNSAWLAMLAALDTAGNGVVVAGDEAAAKPGGMIDALRADDETGEAVSSVDVVDLADGRVGVVYALAEQVAGEAGHYGVGDGADGVLAPAPSVGNEPTADSAEEPADEAVG